jgi:hypothetical protein
MITGVAADRFQPYGTIHTRLREDDRLTGLHDAEALRLCAGHAVGIVSAQSGGPPTLVVDVPPLAPVQVLGDLHVTRRSRPELSAGCLARQSFHPAKPQGRSTFQVNPFRRRRRGRQEHCSRGAADGEVRQEAGALVQ